MQIRIQMRIRIRMLIQLRIQLYKTVECVLFKLCKKLADEEFAVID